MCRVAVGKSGRDLFVLDLAEKLEDSVPQNSALQALREASAEVAVQCSWPTRKDEAYRFTDIRFLQKLQINPVVSSSAAAVELSEAEDDEIRFVFVDGVYSPQFSNINIKGASLPSGVFIGSVLESSRDENLRRYILPKQIQDSPLLDKDVFASLNGIGALDLGVVLVPKNVKLDTTVHVIYYSSGGEDGGVAMSNPRLLVITEEGSELKLIEEFVGAKEGGGGGGGYWTNSVCEISVANGASVSHSYIQTQTQSAVNIKKTYVSQEESSGYKLVEVELGGKLSRHNLHVEQQGPDTRTEMSTFLLCGPDQLQDLHSKLVLNHPRGYARQLHKSIVTSSTGHAVFDGNIRVNRYAQQTDAGQLSRCLLLAPRATVNVKPNLQIVADDVKCSHGAAISDLEEEQLFYFRARGISGEEARSALVFSFGAEVVEKMDNKLSCKRVEDALNAALASHLSL